MYRGLCRVSPYFCREYQNDVNRHFVCHFSLTTVTRPLVAKCYQALASHAKLFERSLHDDRSKRSRNINNFKLMDFDQIAWPNVFKSLKNIFMSFMIKSYYDSNFTTKGFLEGTEQALRIVSLSISAGDFDSLNGLVTAEALDEIKKNFAGLTSEQKKFIAVNPNDLFLKLIYEIGMIFDDDSRKRFVEITTVLQGFHGLEKIKEESVENCVREMQAAPHKLFICNYRFIREYTEGIEDSWVINKLNHFIPQIND